MESSKDINCSSKRKALQGREACSSLAVRQFTLKKSLGLISIQNMNFKYWHSLLLGMDQTVPLFLRKQRRLVRNRILSKSCFHETQKNMDGTNVSKMVFSLIGEMKRSCEHLCNLIVCLPDLCCNS